MKNPCDECRKNKYCRNSCRKLRKYAEKYVISEINKRMINVGEERKMKNDR